MPRLTLAALALTVVTVLGVLLPGPLAAYGAPGRPAVAHRVQAARTVAAPRPLAVRETAGPGASAARPAVALCGIAMPRGARAGAYETPAEYTGGKAPHLARVVDSSSGLRDFTYDARNGDLYAESPTEVVQMLPNGQVRGRFSIPDRTAGGEPLRTGNADPSLAVDPAGAVYLYLEAPSGYVLVRLATSGTRWVRAIAGVPNGLFAWHDPAGQWAAAVVMRNASRGRSELFRPSGAVVRGHVPVPGTGTREDVDAEPSGSLLSTDGRYVREYAASGVPVTPSRRGVPRFGSAASPSAVPGAAFSFDALGGVAAAGKNLYVADAGDPNEGHGLDVFTRTGIYEGDVPATALDDLLPSSELFVDARHHVLYFQTSAGIERASTSAVLRHLEAAAPATEDGFGDTLGIGAGLVTSRRAGYFPAGTRAVVRARFDRWWASYPDPLALRYWVGDRSVLEAGSPKAVELPLGHGRRFRSSVSLRVARSPGVYLVNADLVDLRSKRTLGSTCLTYAVGAPGDRLDFAALSPGVDAGGPAPQRGVELAAALGTGGWREQLDLAMLLPDCSPSAPTAATCGPSALQRWGAYDPATERAAATAERLGVHFEVQVGQDDPVDEAVVRGGYWGADVTAIVRHFHESAPDLAYLEAWNEPNSGPYTPATYVSDVLEPFYRAVHLVDHAEGASVEVIGGSVVGMDVAGWWTGIAKAGGFADMDIVGIHPYTGYDRSFEEEGTPAAIAALERLMAVHGAGGLPVWDTEQGWWSDGEEAFYDVGDWAARAWMWLRALRVRSWNYFVTEGQYDGYGEDFSLIEATSTDDYVKPAGIGLMTVSRVLAGRRFLRRVKVPVPHAYGMLFGPRTGATERSDVLALWTDDLAVPASLTVAGRRRLRVHETAALGATTTLTVKRGSPAPIELSGSPVYLRVPAGEHLSVSPTEAFPTDLALARTGASAVASSSASEENAPGAVLSGNASADGGGTLASTPAWASRTPARARQWIAIRWARPAAVDRVVVTTSSIASILPGLRSYAVLLRRGGRWRRVASVHNEFFDRSELVHFPAVHGVTGVRIDVEAIDYGDLVGGARPFFWSKQPAPAVVYSVAVYSPGAKRK